MMLPMQAVSLRITPWKEEGTGVVLGSEYLSVGFTDPGGSVYSWMIDYAASQTLEYFAGLDELAKQVEAEAKQS